MKVKNNLQTQTKKDMLDKMLPEKLFNDKTEFYHHVIITLRQFEKTDKTIATYLENTTSDFCKTSFNTVLKKINESTDDGLKAVTGINLNCFRFIKEVLTEDDLTFMQGKEKRNLTADELQYYLFRITKKVFAGGGYSSDARNYYTHPGLKEEYKAKTNRKIGKEKIAEMNKILNKYDWINIYQQKKTPNLFVIGKQNPFYHVEGIMEPKTVAEIEQVVTGKELFPVKQTQKDQEIKKLKQQLKEAKDSVAELSKEVKELEKCTPDVEALQSEIDYLTKRNQELLDECMKYHQQQDGSRWSISNKPVKKPDTFESDLTDLISGKKNESIPNPDILSDKEILANAIESFDRMAG